jgi:hypothetical protein
MNFEALHNFTNRERALGIPKLLEMYVPLVKYVSHRNSGNFFSKNEQMESRKSL